VNVSTGTRRKPLIGISLSFHDFGDYSGVGFPRPVARAGGIPLTLPRLPESFEDVLDLCDGLMLAGGRDIAPEHYDQLPNARLGATDPARDAFELELVRRAVARGMPIIGTCRGMQVLNVALGGSLVQDVSLVPDWAAHPSDPTWTVWKQIEEASLKDLPLPAHPRHSIAVTPGSLLHNALGTDRIEVNSFHHQAIGDLAPGVRVTARAPDGVIEALEVDGGFMLGMQCELQEEWRVEPRFLAVFARFIEAAATYAGEHHLSPSLATG
jgi:putative glutamine amidotransferase